MATSRLQRSMLVAVCCSAAAAPGFSERIGHPDLAGPPELTMDPCKVSDPGDPHQILGPNPAHAGCLTALYPPLVPSTVSSDATATSATAAAGEDLVSLSITGTLWLYVAGIGMLVLAGFNSRKRHRHLVAPEVGGSNSDRPPGHRQIHREGARWNED